MYHRTMRESGLTGIVSQMMQRHRAADGNDQSGDWPLQKGEVQMDSRLWFQIVRFYFRIMLFGDPTEPKAKPKQTPKAVPVARLKPLTQPR